MNALPSARAISMGVTAAMLAGCGGGSGTPLSPSPGFTAQRTHVRPAYSVLYSFKGYPDDGKWPFAGLINVSGTLYGTTWEGGGNECRLKRGCGTVFAITTSGEETVFHSLKGRTGYYPDSAVLDVSGTLYGTTSDGGANNYYGTVFEITPTGEETVLHSFGRLGDGANPIAGLINVSGTLYGTTPEGADSYSNGTVFAITTAGKETVLHRFGGSPDDGSRPQAALINVSGTLYGTTDGGGAKGDGTVFAITPSGTETVLHSFTAAGDGQLPAAGLLDVNGTLYGTTAWGGSDGCSGPSGDSGCGTVFKITTSGEETVLHRFAGGSRDGALPQAGLVNVKGVLYGTTTGGGANCSSSGGCGTVFKITRTGKETVLYSFKGGSGDGDEPTAGLLNVKGTLYGTTPYGGANYDGTVFSLSP
jgi:uncharacterized repeat protein (TIGR03803 family)